MAPADDSNDGWQYRVNPLHQHYVVDCMKFVKGVNFDKNHVFLREDLTSLRPNHIVHWLQKRAYGKPDITDADRPTKGRAGSLEKAKGGVDLFYKVSGKRLDGCGNVQISKGRNGTGYDCLPNGTTEPSCFPVPRNHRLANYTAYSRFWGICLG